MAILEYRSLNQIRKYPFKDTSSLLSNELEQVSNTLFVELQLYTFTTTQFKTYISKLEVNTGAAVLSIVFQLYSLNDVAIATETVNIPFASCVKNELYTYQTASLAIKLIFGYGVDSFILADKILNFTSSSLRLLDSCCVSQPPVVSSITLENNSTTFVEIETGEAFDLDAGSNILLDASGISVIAGAGTGFHNPCTDDLNILSINFVDPNTVGNFLLTADGCYEVTPGVAQITYDNVCKPKCTAEQFKALGNYMLRLQDGMNSIGLLAKDIADDLFARIEAYRTGEALTKNDPYTGKAVAKFPSSTIGQFYYSVVLGLFNPSANDVLLNVTITGGTPVANTIRLVTSTTTEVLPNLVISSKTIPCTSQARLEFIVKAATLSLTVTGTLGAININQTITAS